MANSASNRRASGPFEALKLLLEDDRSYRLVLALIVIGSGTAAWAYHLYFRLPDLYDVPSWGFYDLRTYVRSGDAYLDGRDIYHVGYMYTPVSVFAFLPLAVLPFTVAVWALSVANLAFIILTSWFLARIFSFYGIVLSKLEFSVLIASVFFFRPVMHTFVAGQVNVAIMLLTTVGFYYLFCRERPWRAATVFFIAFAIKLWPLSMFLLGFQGGIKSRFLGASLVLVGGFTLISFAVFDLDTHRTFLEEMRRRQTESQAFYNDGFNFFNPEVDLPDWNSSVYGLFARILTLLVSSDAMRSLPQIWTASMVLLSAGILGLLYLGNTKTDQARFTILAFSMMTILPLVVSRMNLTYYGAFLVPCLALLVAVVRLTWQERLILLLAITGIGAWDHIAWPGFHLGGPVRSLLYIFHGMATGLVLLFGLNCWLLWRLAFARSPTGASQSLDPADANPSIAASPPGS